MALLLSPPRTLTGYLNGSENPKIPKYSARRTQRGNVSLAGSRPRTCKYMGEKVMGKLSSGWSGPQSPVSPSVSAVPLGIILSKANTWFRDLDYGIMSAQQKMGTAFNTTC